MSWFLRAASCRFRRGLVVQSGTLDTFRQCLPFLGKLFDNCQLDLLTCYPSDTADFHIFDQVWEVTEVSGSMAKLRLLLNLRKEYDLLVVLTTNEPIMRRWRVAAMLLLQPKKVFAFNENGDGYWLDWANRRFLWQHIVWRLNRGGLSPVRVIVCSLMRVVLSPLVYLYLFGFVLVSYARRRLGRHSGQV